MKTLAGRGRTLVLAGAALALFGASDAVAQQLPTPRQITDRYIQAVGGRDAFKAQQFRHMVMEMSMPAMGMSFTMDIKVMRPNKMLTTMEMPGMGTITTGYDGTVAWMNNPMTGPQILEGQELNQALRQSDIDASIDFERLYPTMETVERTERGGRACYNVRMVSPDNDTVFSCFDVENGLIVAVTAKQTSQMGEVEVTSLLSDYKDFGGIKLPTRTTAQMMGMEMVTTIKSVDSNPIDPSVFELPAEIKALAAQKQQQ